jgi:hypothetical protein
MLLNYTNIRIDLSSPRRRGSRIILDSRFRGNDAFPINLSLSKKAVNYEKI